MCVCVMCVCVYVCMCARVSYPRSRLIYGVPTISRLLKIIRLFCKKTLKRYYILKTRPIFEGSQLIVAMPCMYADIQYCVCTNVGMQVCMLYFLDYCVCNLCTCACVYVCVHVCMYACMHTRQTRTYTPTHAPNPTLHPNPTQNKRT